MTAIRTRPAIGLDLGTSGVRGVRLGDNGRVLGKARRPLAARRDENDGAHEHVAAELESCVRDVLHELLTPDDTPDHPVALAVAGTSGSLLLAEPRTPYDALTTCWLYDDRRSRYAATDLAADFSGGRANGHPAAGAGGSAARWMALARHHGLPPERAKPVHPADWIALRLLDGPPARPFSDHHNALKLGFDPGTTEWLAVLPAALARRMATAPSSAVTGAASAPEAIIRALPHPVFVPGHRVGAALNGRVVLHAGTTDANAAFVASLANVSRSRTEIHTTGVTSLGSTLVVKQLSPHRIDDAASGVYSHRLGNAWIVSGASNSGTAALQRHFSTAEIGALSATIDLNRSPTPGVRALNGRGERFPWPDANAEPVDPPPELAPVDRLHDLLAALADVEREGYARFAALGAPPITRVVSNGGGAINDVWRRLRSARLGVPVDAFPEADIGWEAAIGAAHLAQRGGALTPNL